MTASGKLAERQEAAGRASSAATILVVDICGSCDGALFDRAQSLASSFGTRVALYAPLPRALDELGTPVDAAKSNCEQRISELSARLNAANVDVQTACEIVNSLADAAVAEIASIKPEFVVVCSALQCPHHAEYANALVFALLERSVSHLWIVQQSYDERRKVMLAAIDMQEGSAASHIRHRVLSVTRSIARTLGKEAHLVHTFSVSAANAVLANLTPDIWTDGREYRVEHAHVLKVHELADQFRYEKEHIHVLPGQLADNLEKLVEPMGADVLVMGASAKSGIDRLVVGDQFDAVLGSIPCDVLVVRP